MHPDVPECEDVGMKRASWAIALLLFAAGCGGGGGGGHATGGSGTTPAAPVLPTYATSSVPSGAGIEDITAAPDGSLWFSEFAAGKIGKYVPSTGTITEISAAGNGPAAIVVRGTTVYVSLFWDGKIGVFGTDGSAKPSIPLPSDRADRTGLRSTRAEICGSPRRASDASRVAT
jgi:streptogramin lyase